MSTHKHPLAKIFYGNPPMTFPHMNHYPLLYTSIVPYYGHMTDKGIPPIMAFFSRGIILADPAKETGTGPASEHQEQMILK